MKSDITNTKEHFGLTETLRKQLLAYATASEITRITAQARSVNEVLEGLCLGFHDLATFSRVMALGIDNENFCLKPICAAGFNFDEIKDFRLSLDFLSGEYSDAIFRNRHIIVDSVPDFDSFSLIDCKSYAVFPILARVTGQCHAKKNCDKTECSCFNSDNPYCWAADKAALLTQAKSEDEKRKSCINCSQFKCEGLLWLDLTGREHITGEDTAMISAAVVQSGFALEAFRTYESLQKVNEQLNKLYEELQKANTQMQADLKQANAIQQKLLPSDFPAYLDVASYYKAHLEVGGDYYDCIELENGNLGFVIADVSGHGTAAAMMMSMFKMLLKATPKHKDSPAQALKLINEYLNEIDSGRFITVFYAIWSPETRELTYTNAGHISIPILNKETDEIILLKSSGLFIGVMPEITVEDCTITLEAPQRLCLYTDGLSEANNRQKEMFGNKRIYETLVETKDRPCNDFLTQISNSVEIFCEGEDIMDDITIFVCDL